MQLVINEELNPALGLIIIGSLDLQGTQITKLPERLSVGGYLDLEGTQITKLPEGLSVGGSLDLRGTQITKLPEGLSVGGTLYLDGTQITNYPVVYDCGDDNRAIYLDLKNKTLIHIGCFVGTKDEAIDAIKDKYDDDVRDTYIAKVEECFQLWETLRNKCKKENRCHNT